MKKLFLLQVIITLSITGWSQSISKAQLRENFLQATMHRSALDSFHAILDKVSSPTAQEECYLGMCNALQIQYVSGMWGKYKMLDKSRGHIAKAIQKAPQDAELRFLRFMLEHNIPSFLGMSTHLKDDLGFIFSHASFMDEDADLKIVAMQFILDSKRCSTDQMALLERTISDMKKKVYAQK